MKIETITKKISKKHNDSFWYESDIAKATKANGTELLLVACGDIRIHNKDGELVYDCKERNSGIKGGLNDDDDLKKIGNDYGDDYYWENNNWFEVLFKKKDMEGYDSIMCNVAHDYDEAIKLLQTYIDDDEY